MIKFSVNDTIAEIILSKNPVNVLGIKELNEIKSLIQKTKNIEEIRLLVFKSDQRVFCAGVDIADHTPQAASNMLKAFHEVFYEMLNLNIPSLALVKGASVGGGCELSLFCDFVLCSESSYFSQPEIMVGCFPPVSVADLTSKIGQKKALEFILTGRKMSSSEALSLGLVNAVYSDSTFDSEAEIFIKKLVSNSKSVTAVTLKAFKEINCFSLKEKIKAAENIYLKELCHLEDYKEGIKSFTEKRPPEWTGR